MYLIVIAWIYVVLMMSVAEATNSNGTLLGAIVTFFMYGVGPAALAAYLMATPARKRALKKREAEHRATAAVPSFATPEPDSQTSLEGSPDSPSHTPGDRASRG